MLLIVNHKANLTYKEIIKYEKQIRKMDIIILPANCYLTVFKKGKYKLGSQDISRFSENNRTGEINAKQLKSLNIKYSLVGHSDRLEYNRETKEDLKEKLNRCLENDIKPLYCLGESDYENYTNEIEEEIDLYFETNNKKETIFIYEPKKNIGNDQADFSKVEEITNYIKSYTNEKYNITPKIIYGGGVRTNNINFIKSIKNIDGIIISKKSLNIKNLKEIYKETKK